MYENIDKNKYTPMMRQYLEIKEQYPDTLVFFRLGDFYEMFFNDALVASRELEIVLTGRDAGTQNDRVPMCGVPHHAVNSYIERLSEKGYKVAIVEQLEEPNGQKLVKRDIVKIVTPGTNIDQEYLNEKNNSYLGCVDKNPSGYFLAYIELSTGETKITQFDAIELVYSELSKLAIKEIVVSKNFNHSICQFLSNNYGILVSYSDETNIDSYMDHLVDTLNEKEKECAKRLLFYVVQTQKRVLVHLQPFTKYQTKDYLRLSENSIRNLEIVETNKGVKFKNNLFVVLDHCSTAMGSRFLKKSLLYPLVNLNKINQRLDIIEELQRNYLHTNDLKSQLQEIYDLERIVGRISYGNLTPKDLIQLRISLGVLPNVKLILSKMKGKVLPQIGESINDFKELHSLLFRAIDENAGYTLKDGNVIKNGFNEELDKIRNIGSTNREYLTNLELRERERTGIKNLKVGYNRVFGYYIEVTKSNLEMVKDEYGYIRKQTTSNSERYITQELKEREALILRSSEMSIELEVKIFNEIREQCKDNTVMLQKLSSIISELDMLISLSEVAKKNNYVRPTFSLYNDLEIIGGRHPIIEDVIEGEFIPNDLTLYNADKVLLITGPNMSGKSTFMRQNALIAIMAQIGSFVPATKATLPIFDQIFTRIGSSDNIMGGESTFMVEMLEVNEALTNATEQSLIIFDEVGRGTATYDGMSLAQAIIEYLHNNVKAKCLFSTHYHELTNLDKSLGFLKNVHVEAKVGGNLEDLIFLHKVVPGPSDESYGINVASLAKIPLPVVLRAKDILEKLESSNHYNSEELSINNYKEPVIIDKTDPRLKELYNEIKNVDLDSMKPIDALLYLSKLKDEVNKNE
ncbi:MAG: DNA mismatch repair protein MutS [Bacilli bacterium]|nr:DNA mismatch repair protein MutS [Bacilli bacterium]MDY4051845.1 DNA mismatch repair protein MutS [Bacilli bacterium]